MLVFFFVLIMVFVINLIIYFSSVIIEVEQIKIDTTKKPFLRDCKVIIYLAFLNKIKYLKIRLYKEKIDRIKGLNMNKIKGKITKLKVFKNLEQRGFANNTKTIAKVIKSIHITLEKIELNVDIGVENITILVYVVAILDILISIILSKKILDEPNITPENYKYIIIPRQTKNGYLKTSLCVKLSLKISNIVKNILYSS